MWKFDVDVLYNRKVSRTPHPDGKVHCSNRYGLDLNIHDYRGHIGSMLVDKHLDMQFVEEIPHKILFWKSGDLPD